MQGLRIAFLILTRVKVSRILNFYFNLVTSTS